MSKAHEIHMNTALKNQTIKEVRYMSDEDREEGGFDEGDRYVEIVFKTGHKIVLMQDPEGNGPGAAFTTFVTCDTLC